MKSSSILAFILGSVLLVPSLPLHSQEASQPEATDANPTFSLTVSANTPEFRVGSDMWITITQKNLTTHDVDCTSEWDGIDRTLLYEATDEDGKPAEKRHRGNPGWDVHGCTLARGEQNDKHILINRVFNFGPGKYTLRIGRRESDLTDDKGNPLVVWSAPITITVTG